MKPGIEELRTLPIFSGFGPDTLAALNEAADLARVGPDEILFRPGEKLAELNFLLAGLIGITHPQRRNTMALVDVLLPVRPLGLPAVLLGLPSPVGAQTLSSARLIVLPVRELLALVADHRDVRPALMDHALRESLDQTRDIYDLKLRSSAQRLATYLIGLIKDPDLSPARFVLPFEKRLLAARIGCSQENFSRAFAALRRLGVETRGAVVVVRDLATLRVFAGSPAADAGSA